jgi:hypothetical protein
MRDIRYFSSKGLTMKLSAPEARPWTTSRASARAVTRMIGMLWVCAELFSWRHSS